MSEAVSQCFVGPHHSRPLGVVNSMILAISTAFLIPNSRLFNDERRQVLQGDSDELMTTR